MDTINIDIKLKDIRLAKGISQNELARRLNISVNHAQRIEWGKIKSITLEMLSKLCNALDCEPGDLLVRKKS